MKMNLKVRFRNPVFWITVIPAAIAFVYTLLGSFGVVPSISQETIVNAITAIITGLATIGVLVDPTTKGVSDSDRALGYTTPNDSSAEDDEL